MSNLKINKNTMALLGFPYDGRWWVWPPQQSVTGGAGSINAMRATSPVPFKLAWSLWLSLSTASLWRAGLCCIDSGGG